MFQYSFFLISLLIGFTHTSSVYALSMPTTSSPVFYYPIVHAFLFNAENGGHPLSCTFCTMLVNALEDYTQQHSLPIDQFILNNYCSLFGNSLQDVCRSTIKKTGPHLLAAMKKSTNPDHICKEIKLCTNPQCNLYPETQRANITFSTQSQVSCGISLNSLHLSSLEASSNHSSTPTTSSSRDHKWRGKACDPTNTDLYPGRKHDPYPSLGLDHNCNGISGVDPSSGRTYEELFCENSKPLGVIVAGDSNGGNFQIPQRWVNASQWHGTPFGDLLDMVENTFNVPEASGLTGFCPDGSPKPCRSVYKYLYERNKCNFRDYQNIAVNGATVKNTLGYLQKLRRDKDLDHPILMFLKLTINDVCVPNMTTTEEFRSHLLEILAHLDAVLPSGSHLTAIGLIEDDIYERMKEKVHPSGVTNQDFYRFTACTGILPCRTLLNPDKELREARLQRVRELNQVYRLTFSEYKAKNFDLAFYDFPKQEIFTRLEEQKMDPTVMYDKMDAFHLSQTYDALLADYLWEGLMNDHPEWLGEVNPHNERIEKLFVHSEIDY